MAEEKKTPEKQGWFKKLIGWIASLPGRIAKAFKNMAAELRQASWPSKKKLISSCITVLLFMLFTGVVVSLLDFGAATAINGLYSISHPIDETLYAEDLATTPTDVITEAGEQPVVEADETAEAGETTETGETAEAGETGETAEAGETVETDETTEADENVQTNEGAETPAE